MDDVARYSIGWIAPLPLKLVAAKAVLDDNYGDIHVDGFIYHGGRIGKHNVVMAVQSKMGTDAASELAARMRNVFRNIEYFVVVGIGGGVPSYGSIGAQSQIMLRDVVVSYPRGMHSGVVRYDFGAWKDEGRLEFRGHTNRPPDSLLNAVNVLQARQSMTNGTKIPAILQEMRANIHIDEQQKFEDQGASQDRLFNGTCSHPGEFINEDCEVCCDLNQSQLRRQRGVEANRQQDTPKVHPGNIGSSNQLQISASKRDELHNDHGIICFEMEGAGVIQNRLSIVIRGICDYSDSHKNKKWQPYAAATAAAYTKEFLEILPTSRFTLRPLTNPIKTENLDLQVLRAAPKATFNTLGKDNDPLCLPNTRVKVLRQIRSWIDGADKRYIFWLSGWAGTGKSTIACTIACEYYDRGCFMASFFFSRGSGDLSHVGKFASSIATQLAQQKCAPYKNALREAMSNDSAICEKTLTDQWSCLILHPLLKTSSSSFRGPLLIVIDALDEYEKKNDIGLILKVLQHFQNLRFLAPRIFITSRSNIPIRYGFSYIPYQDHHDMVLHNLSRTVVDHDIFTFLQHALRNIQQKCRLEENWPGVLAIKRLTQKTSGLFIWASIAARFIGEGGLLATKRLSLILDANVPLPIRKKN
ncbi:purine and uridine phosphorylase [Lojkania enalia]|uniref:Purine and uridine phosphorylase n=1 Tax=Lojkania enalia TaxID=147567 RepID=A0A9P4MX50_9PLEO|nr:purine and uridine phosphorylase [Didymosphaeria enalia]